jgi:hypothetical protein
VRGAALEAAVGLRGAAEIASAGRHPRGRGF